MQQETWCDIFDSLIRRNEEDLFNVPLAALLQREQMAVPAFVTMLTHNLAKSLCLDGTILLGAFTILDHFAPFWSQPLVECLSCDSTCLFFLHPLALIAANPSSLSAGLFRVAPNQQMVRRLRKRLNKPVMDVDLTTSSPYDIVALLIAFLEELPEVTLLV